VRRRLLIAAIFLLAGAVVNVAVAWGCAAWADVMIRSPVGLSGLSWLMTDDYTEGISEDGTASLLRWSSNVGTLIYFERTRTATLDRTMRGSLRMDELSPYWLHLDVPSAAYQSGRIDFENSFTDARGWPALTMWSEYEWPPHGQTVVVKGGLPLSSRHSVSRRYFSPPLPRALPLRPIWSGFAVNTLFYATFLWLLICGPFVLRRFIRVKRGLCPACAYQRGESEVCSECGKDLPGRARVAT